jgi:hypothetical protein
MYEVNFGTGAGNESFDTLEEAKDYAIKNISYTGKGIVIWKNDVPFLIANFHERGSKQGKKVIADFGKFGFVTEFESFY